MNLFKQIDILTIGDIATEPFIKIKEAEAETEYDKEEKDWKLCLDYGGKIPYESAEVCSAAGNGPNVAITASRLGLNTSVVSYVGNDDVGKNDIEKLKGENVDTEYVKKIDGLDSNYHYVLWYKGERTILVKHTEFPYSFPDISKKPKWIYLSSLAVNSTPYHNEIIKYIKDNPEVSLAFQPGTFQIRLGIDPIKDLYKNTKIFFSNKEEAQKVLGTKEDSIPELLKMIHNVGPQTVVITKGVEGAYVYDGKEIMFMGALYDKTKTVESTGAGDAFAGSFLSALILGKDIYTALMWGTINASSVVEYVGPHKGLLNQEKIEEYIKNIPEELKPKKID